MPFKLWEAAGAVVSNRPPSAGWPLKTKSSQTGLARQRCPEPNLFPVVKSSFCCVGFEMRMSNARAIRYRKLALVQEDSATADLLRVQILE